MQGAWPRVFFNEVEAAGAGGSSGRLLSVSRGSKFSSVRVGCSGRRRSTWPNHRILCITARLEAGACWVPALKVSLVTWWNHLIPSKALRALLSKPSILFALSLCERPGLWNTERILARLQDICWHKWTVPLRTLCNISLGVPASVGYEVTWKYHQYIYSRHGKSFSYDSNQ